MSENECPHASEPRGCYRVRCQLGRKCVEAAAPAATENTEASTLPDCMAELILRHGGIRPLARAAGLDPGYIHRLHTGEKGEPSADTLAALGITRSVSYALATPPSPAPATPMENQQ